MPNQPQDDHRAAGHEQPRHLGGRLAVGPSEPLSGEAAEQARAQRRQGAKQAFGVPGFADFPEVGFAEDEAVEPGPEVGGGLQVGRAEAGHRYQLHQHRVAHQHNDQQPQLGAPAGFQVNGAAPQKHQGNALQHAHDAHHRKVEPGIQREQQPQAKQHRCPA